MNALVCDDDLIRDGAGGIYWTERERDFWVELRALRYKVPGVDTVRDFVRCVDGVCRWKVWGGMNDGELEKRDYGDDEDGDFAFACELFGCSGDEIFATGRTLHYKNRYYRHFLWRRFSDVEGGEEWRRLLLESGVRFVGECGIFKMWSRGGRFFYIDRASVMRRYIRDGFFEGLKDEKKREN